MNENERLDIHANKIDDVNAFMEKLSETLGLFQREYGVPLEGRLWLGETIVWFQRFDETDDRGIGENPYLASFVPRGPIDTSEFDK